MTKDTIVFDCKLFWLDVYLGKAILKRNVISAEI